MDQLLKAAKPAADRLEDSDSTANASTSATSSSNDVASNADVAPSAGLPPPASVFSFGSSSIIGVQTNKPMEDYVRIAPAFLSISGETYDFFGVFDGHGGSEVAELCSQRMHLVVAEEAARSAMEAGADESRWWSLVIDRSFEFTDGEVAELRTRGGSTAVVAVVGPRLIVVANCGDSRAVFKRGQRVHPLTYDHKPRREDELKRIEEAGGRVLYLNCCDRVEGVLAMSRALGDFELRPYVISKPEVTVVDRSQQDEFMALATDGLWDVLSNNDVCKLVADRLTGGRSGRRRPEPASDAVAGLLTSKALRKGSRDNISAVIVQFKALP